MKITKHVYPMAIAMLLCLPIISCKNDNYQTQVANASLEQVTAIDTIARGKYLVGILGCNDCHSPKQNGERGPEIIPELLLSGFPSNRPIVKMDDPLIKEGFAMFYPDLTAAKGPWGTSFAANLTPDATGLGSWSETQFKKALTEGKFKGLDNSRMLLPPMPWMNYIGISDEDIHAIFLYLKSIKPVENVVPSAIAPDNL